MARLDGPELAGTAGRASTGHWARTCVRRRELAQSGMFLLIKVAGSLAAVYLGVVVLLTAFQDRLLFPRWAMGPDAPPPSAEHLKLDLDSGATLIGVYLPAPVAPRETTSLLLGFGGNHFQLRTCGLEDLACTA